jgi:hypothetical protein
VYALLTLLAMLEQPSLAVGAEVLVVCDPTLRPALEPWVAYRTAQGHRLTFIEPRGSVEDLPRRVQALARERQATFIVLVGDAPGEASATSSTIAAPHVPAKVNVHWGSEPELISDAPYADLDADGLPDVSIGRLPADNPEQLATIVRKTLAFERAPAGAWQRQLHFVAGAAGGGTWIDTAMESLARSILCERIPPAYATTMTYASWTSPFCPPPPWANDYVLGRLTQGSLFWVYLGHGQRQFVDPIRVPRGYHNLLDANDLNRLRPSPVPPIALLMACYTGAIDDEEDCLAESLVTAPQGPVAAIAASRVTMPYGMSVLGLGLLDGYFRHHAPTLGQWLLQAKRRSVSASRDDARSRALDALSAALNPAGTDPADERREHALMFNLLGDPLLVLPRLAAVELDVPTSAVAAGVLEVRGTSPIDGLAHVELVVRRDRLAFDYQPRRDYDESATSLERFAHDYRRANDPRLAAVRVPTTGGRFSAQLPIGSEARGPCHVRVLIVSPETCAVGASDVTVDAPGPATATAGGEQSPRR